MNNLNKFFLKKIRGAYFRLFKPINLFYNKKSEYNNIKIVEGTDANDMISQVLLNGKPAMIARFGSVEFLSLQHFFQYRKKGLKKHINYIKGGQPGFWENVEKNPLFFNAGVFPNTEEMFVRFSIEYETHLPNIDVLACWLDGEEYFHQTYFPHAKLISLFSYEPYFHSNPWSMHLEGKNVLVIHPFAVSIQNQYKKRELLFKDDKVLPKFNLITYKAVQSIAGNKTNFTNWKVALDTMVDDISKIDFDIAIIGAGAYGLPLASYVKQMGKIGIHLGGATQVLFGIWGNRYNDPRENELYRKLKNENWISPANEEKPKNFQNIENGCYW